MSTVGETTDTARLPRLGETAPDFTAKSTHGEIRLSDYTAKGRWVLLFSHPSDFTPVCTTEFVEFARRWPEFEALNVQLVGVSIAGQARMIEAQRVIIATGSMERPFPIPGWTLPGVMTAGAAQTALKAQGLVPTGRTLITAPGTMARVLATSTSQGSPSPDNVCGMKP